MTLQAHTRAYANGSSSPLLRTWLMPTILWLLGSVFAYPLYGQNRPWGVAHNNYIWFKADAGLTLASDGSSVQQWKSSVSAEVALPASASGAPKYRAEEVSMNFNATLSSGGGLVVDEINKAVANGGSFFIVMNPSASQPDDDSAPFSTVDNNLNRAGGRIDVSVGNFGSSAGLETKLYTSVTPSLLTRNYEIIGTSGLLDDILDLIKKLLGLGSGANAFIGTHMVNVDYRNDRFSHYIDGKGKSLTSLVSRLLGGQGALVSDLNLFLGNKRSNLAVSAWNGMISEVIVFFDPITEAQRANVTTYLAVKYGITLSQATPRDYVASDGRAIIWDGARASRAGKNQNIAIIGRDDVNGLYQVKSQSVNRSAVFTIQAQDEGSNGKPTFVDMDDLEFFSWSDDNGSTAEQTLGLPSSMGLFRRLGREWFVQESGEVGLLKITANLSDIKVSGSSVGHFKLLVSTDGRFDRGNLEVIPATSYDAATGTVVFSDVNLADGQYFTLVTQSVPLVVQFTQSEGRGLEKQGSGLPQLTVSGGVTGVAYSVSVGLSKDSQTAAAGVDYNPSFSAPMSISIPAGDYTFPKIISIPGLAIVDDNMQEGDETLVLQLQPPTGGPSLGARKTTSYTITDDDGLSVVFSQASGSIMEGSSTGLPQLAVSGGVAPSASVVEVALDNPTGSATPGVDYRPDFASVVRVPIPAGDYSTAKSIVIPGFAIVDDNQEESDETINLVLQNPGTGLSLGGQKTASYTITDNDKITASFDRAKASGTEGGVADLPKIIVVGGVSSANHSVEVALANPPGSATPGVDYTPSFSAPISVNIPAGDYTTAKEIALTGIQIVDDNHVEGDEVIEWVLQSPAGDVGLGSQKTFSYTIVDNDGLVVEFVSDSESIGEDGLSGSLPRLRVSGGISSTNQTVEITLDSPAGSATAGVDYTPSFTSPVVVNIPAGNYTTARDIGIPGLAVINDSDAEQEEDFTLLLQSPSAGIRLGSRKMALCSIVDNDEAPTVTLSESVNEIQEAGGQVVITASLSKAATVNVSIDLSFGGSASAGSYNASSQTLVIPAGNLSGTVTLTAVDNASYEGDSEISISIDKASNALISRTATRYISIKDDEQAPILSVKVDQSSISENGGMAIVTAELSGVSGAEVVVRFAARGSATDNGVDYSLSASSIIIPAGQTTGTLEIRATPDQLSEGDEAIILTVANVVGADGSGVQPLQITLSDGTPAQPNSLPVPVVSLLASNQYIDENGGQITLTVELSNAYSAAVAFDIVLSGSASYDDFEIDPKAPFIIPAGQISLSILITGIKDEEKETDEYAIFTLANPSSATLDQVANSVTVMLLDSKIIGTEEVFSPNGDGINDAWVIKNVENYPNNHVRIFNRWGDLVYEVNGYNNLEKAFVGRSSINVIGGSDLPSGTYFYLIRLGDGSREISGFISLFR